MQVFIFVSILILYVAVGLHSCSKNTTYEKGTCLRLVGQSACSNLSSLLKYNTGVLRQLVSKSEFYCLSNSYYCTGNPTNTDSISATTTTATTETSTADVHFYCCSYIEEFYLCWHQPLQFLLLLLPSTAIISPPITILLIAQHPLVGQNLLIIVASWSHSETPQ